MGWARDVEQTGGCPCYSTYLNVRLMRKGINGFILHPKYTVCLANICLFSFRLVKFQVFFPSPLKTSRLFVKNTTVEEAIILSLCGLQKMLRILEFSHLAQHHHGRRVVVYDCSFFFQLFKDDIMYLLTMDKLWKKRKAPTPLDWHQLENSGMSFMHAELKPIQAFSITWRYLCSRMCVQGPYFNLFESGRLRKELEIF